VLDFEANPEFEFEFYLAEKLSRTVTEMRQMDNDEFVRWSVYYARIAQREELERLKAKRR
jgi:hypothetical protein